MKIEEIKAEKSAKTSGFNSFEVAEKIGRGAFGSVYKCFLKNNLEEPYAMKVLKKASLQKTKHLNYAISERNILSTVDHPFVIKMHQSF